MPKHLAGWCVLLAMTAGSAFAADKPKGKKATADPMLGGALPAEGKFVVTKPVGTWVRDVQMKEASVRILLAITDDRLDVTLESVDGEKSNKVRVTADYAINKESCLFGVLDSVECDDTEADFMLKATKTWGAPFSIRFRQDDGSLFLKDPMGFSADGGSGSLVDGSKMLILCGRYTQLDPSKPLPPLQVAKNPKADEAALKRQEELLQQSDYLRTIAETWRRLWQQDQPQYLTPQRIHGGILKAEPPKEEFESRIDRVPLPTPHYLKHYPHYVPPDPAFPLQKERDLPLDPTGEIRRGNPPACQNVTIVREDQLAVEAQLLRQEGEQVRFTMFAGQPTSAYGGSVGGAVEALRQRAAVVQAKAEVPSPQCDDPPTDAEVMRAFGERAKAFGDDITIVKNNVAEKIDAPQLFPLVGMARTHCCQWECGVYFRDGTTGKPKVEVIRLDHQKMRLVVPAAGVSVPQRMTEK